MKISGIDDEIMAITIEEKLLYVAKNISIFIPGFKYTVGDDLSNT